MRIGHVPFSRENKQQTTKVLPNPVVILTTNTACANYVEMIRSKLCGQWQKAMFSKNKHNKYQHHVQIMNSTGVKDLMISSLHGKIWGDLKRVGIGFWPTSGRHKAAECSDHSTVVGAQLWVGVGN